ncbi:MAG: VWA domain-containing protein [Ignavibacteria bacterium]|nr:VWA domain-containing protein [Ignavibacteria bacterium]
MTFLNPLLLWGLAAVSIPILIHIFNLKRTKKIEFSTLMFLKEIQQSKYKKIKLKQLLILLSRIAFIIFLVMMFAKPYETGFLGAPAFKSKSSVLIILDDSFSMQTRDNNGNDLENGKKKINMLLDALGPNNEIFFTTISAINKPSASIPFKDMNSIKDTLALIKTSAVTRDLNEVMYYAEDILNSSSNTLKEVYLVTDGQTSFLKKDAAILPVFKDNDNLNFSVILTGIRNANNISIDTINTVSKIFEKNRPVKIKAVLNNHNNFNSVNKSVIITFGNFKEEKVLDIPANSLAEAEFILKPEQAGYSSGSIELVQNDISDDEISADNRQYFGFYVPEKVNVLIASPTPYDAEYIKLVLNTSKEISPGADVSTFFNIKEVNSSDISNEDFNSYNSIIIINKQRFSTTEAAKVKNYVESGGGVLLYPGNLSEIDNYNNELMKLMDLPYITGRFSLTEPAKFDKVDLEHPVFEGIFKSDPEKKNVSIESPAVLNGITPGGGKNAQSIVTLTNGTNFMEEYTMGKGRLLMFASPPDMNSSDFPAKNLFSPVTIRSILYSANINGIKPAVTGKDYFIDLDKNNLVYDSINVVSSKDIISGKFLLTENAELINVGASLLNTDNYSIMNAGKNMVSFPVNFSRSESISGRMEIKDISSLLNEGYGLKSNVVAPQDLLVAAIIDTRNGRDLWMYFLLVAVIFLIIEYLLSRSIMKSK